MDQTLTAILLGTAFLGERLEPRQSAGMALIGIGLAVLDGRLVALGLPLPHALERGALGLGVEQRRAKRTLSAQAGQQAVRGGLRVTALAQQGGQPGRVVVREVAGVIRAEHAQVAADARGQHRRAAAHGLHDHVGAALHGAGVHQHVGAGDGQARAGVDGDAPDVGVAPAAPAQVPA